MSYSLKLSLTVDFVTLFAEASLQDMLASQSEYRRHTASSGLFVLGTGAVVFEVVALVIY